MRESYQEPSLIDLLTRAVRTQERYTPAGVRRLGVTALHASLPNTDEESTEVGQRPIKP